MFGSIRRLLGQKPATGKPVNMQRSFSIPVLCYHSWTIDSDSYVGNDHLALATDLRTLADRGYQVLPLTLLVEMLRGERELDALAETRLVGISFDDGRDHDYLDVYCDSGAHVSSMHAVLDAARSYIEIFGEGAMAVSFVIASPDARALLDLRCGKGQDQWRDEWWAECAARGIIGIANHSWDHVHSALDEVRQQDNLKGSFLAIESFEDAEAQIAAAQRYIQGLTDGRALPLFAYPYGHVAPYLRDQYFPAHGERVGLRAAFGTGGASVRPDSPIWDIPRFVCGWHWRTPEDFGALLDGVERGER